MTATILPLGAESVRGWRIAEIEPGVWRGDLIDRALGTLRRTETGTLWLVRDSVERHRNGLPIFFKPIARSPGPAAA